MSIGLDFDAIPVSRNYKIAHKKKKFPRMGFCKNLTISLGQTPVNHCMSKTNWIN